MNSALDRNRVTELLPLYVIGALEAEEMLAIEAYLQQHPDWQERLAALEAVLAQIVQSVPTAPLPTDARTRLLARVQGDIASTTPVDARNAATQAGAQPPISYQHPLRRLRRRQSSPPPPPINSPQWQRMGRATGVARLGWLAGAFSLLLTFLLLGLTLLQQSRITALSAEVVRLRELNQQIEQQLEGQTQQLALFLAAERNVALVGTALAPEAQGAFYLSDAEGIVVLRGLTPLPADRTYQLWLVPPNGVPTSVAILPLQTLDLVAQTVLVPPALRNFAIVDVSIEQAGGSPAITKETIVLRGTIH